MMMRLVLQLLRREVELETQSPQLSQIHLVPVIVRERKIRIRLLGWILHPDTPLPPLQLTLLPVRVGIFLALSLFSLLTLTFPLLLLRPAMFVFRELAPELLVILLFLMFRLVLMLEGLKSRSRLLLLVRWIVLISSLVLLTDRILVVGLRGVVVELLHRRLSLRLGRRGLRV
jgi:hypothetical protein